MNKEEILYQNKWCKIVSEGTYHILKSKTDKYSNQYFLTLYDAKKYIGVV